MTLIWRCSHRKTLGPCQFHTAIYAMAYLCPSGSCHRRVSKRNSRHDRIAMLRRHLCRDFEHTGTTVTRIYHPLAGHLSLDQRGGCQCHGHRHYGLCVMA